MARSSIGNTRVYGTAVLDRIGAGRGLKGSAAQVKAFRGAHEQYEAAAKRVDAARVVRDASFEAIGAADDVLDRELFALADRLVGAGMGQRKNPFAAFSTHSPAEMTGLAYAEEVAAAEGLVAKIGKKKPAGEVARAVAAVARAAAGVAKALRALSGPQGVFDRARGERDALLLPWDKALRTLKRHAAAELDDDVAGYKALFAAVEKVQVATKPRRKKPAGSAVPVPN